MDIIHLSVLDLGLASLLIVALGAMSLLLHLGIARSLFISATRTVVQLLLVGLVLKLLFVQAGLGWITLMALVMLLVAGREVMARQQRRLRGVWGYGVGTLSMFVSTFTITIVMLVFVIETEPWYAPQYAIPLLGMMFGNTMNGIAIGMDRLTQLTWEQREVIEARLTVGQDWRMAISEIRQESIRAGLIPIINAMAAAGIVSLPGMMTGQILAGVEPLEAVNYQILIMFMIAGGTGFGTVAAVILGARRLFDQRERLRVDRLTGS